MKILLTLLITAIVASAAYSQKVISKSEYEGNFNGSVSVTNKAFPFVFTVVIDNYENGKVVSTSIDVYERQASGVERETRTLVKNGRTFRSYGITLGFEKNTYCSRDGKTWIGPQEYVCPSPDNAGLTRLYGRRTPQTAEYTVTDKTINGKVVKVYREYAIFASGSGKKDFKETTAMIDENGFFIEVFNTEGTLEPRVVTLTRKQTWQPNAKFAPVVAPR